MDNIEQKIEDLFSRSVASFVNPDGVFKKKLLAKAQGKYDSDVIVKFGMDPTRPDIHIGHAVVFRRLRQLQDLGCKVVFLVGDFTVQIGDPEGKSIVRPEVAQETAEANMRTYLDQAGKILNTDPKVFSWIRNSEWYYGVTDMQPKEGIRISLQDIVVNPRSFAGKALLYENTRMQKTHLGKSDIRDVTLRGLFWTLRHITHSRLIQRDMFQERLKNGKELYMHEMLYPVLQGIDSYLISLIYGSCDLEIGGNDQTFNMLMGRDVQRANSLSEQAVLSLRLLTGLDGKEKMSKSLDNYVGITDAPADMYGKVMSIPDSSLAEWFELCTYTTMHDVREILKGLENGAGSDVNPRDVKMRLAREIVSIYHGEEKAKQAEEEYVSVFQKGELPSDMPIVPIADHKALEAQEILEVFFFGQGEKKSRSDIRRLIEQGAIIYQGKKLTDPRERISPNQGDIVKVGKRQWFKVGAAVK